MGANSEPRGWVAVMVLNNRYVEMTQSWACNAGLFRNVLSRTLFVCTDAQAARRMLAFDPTLHVVHLQLGSKQDLARDLTYGEPDYWLITVVRTCMLAKVVRAGVSLNVIEADAFWIDDGTVAGLQDAARADSIATDDRAGTG